MSPIWGTSASSSFRTDQRNLRQADTSTFRPVSTTAIVAVKDRVLIDDPAARSAPSGYPTVIWLLLGGSLMVRSAGFAYPFMAYYVSERGHAAGTVGAVLAAFGVGWAVGQLVCGWLVDRITARPTLVSAMLVAAIVLVLMTGARSFPALLLGAAVAGMVLDAPRLVLGAAIAELIPEPERRAKLDAWRYGWVLNVGSAVTGGLGGLLAGWLGTSALYLINGIACAVFAVLAASCLPSAGRHPAVAAAMKVSYWQAFSDKRLMLLSASGLATLTALMGLFAVVPMLMTGCGLDAGCWGCVQIMNALAVIAITPLMTPWLSGRLANGPRLDILAGAAVWVALCMGVGALAHTTLGFSMAMAACAPGEVAWFVVSAGIVHRIASPTNVGRYQGIWSMNVAVAAVVAPLLASCSLTHGGCTLVAATTATVGLIGAALCLPLARVLAGANEIPSMS
jgi:MFS family permease